VLEHAAATIIERAQVRRHRVVSTGGSLFLRGTKKALDATRTLIEYGGFSQEYDPLNIFGLLRIRERRGEHTLGVRKIGRNMASHGRAGYCIHCRHCDRLVNIFETLFSERLGHLLPDATAA